MSMSDKLIELNGKCIAFRRCAIPCFVRRFACYAIKRRVIFDRIKVPGMECQFVVALDFGRIKKAGPVVIMPSRCTDIYICHYLKMVSPKRQVVKADSADADSRRSVRLNLTHMHFLPPR